MNERDPKAGTGLPDLSGMSIADLPDIDDATLGSAVARLLPLCGGLNGTSGDAAYGRMWGNARVAAQGRILQNDRVAP